MKHTNTVKEGNAFTGGWKTGSDLPGDEYKCCILNEEGRLIAQTFVNPYFTVEEAEANARLIAESKNLFKIVGELIQYLEWREDFLIEDSEEGETNVYTQAKAIINRINNQ